MKNILFFIGALVSAIVTAFILHNWLSSYEGSGYVTIGIGHWALETSLVAFSIFILFSFFVFYFFFRFLGWLIRMPAKIKMRGKSVQFNRSQEALVAGLIDSAEGNWERSEKTLIKHASNSGAPLIHYLTAARAADSRGAIDKRDEYLQQATQHAPGSEIAVGLTQAELHLSHKQFDQALATLINLHSIDSSHASVLKLLHQTYTHLGDWQAIHALLPSLESNKILIEAEIKLLEVETYSSLLKSSAESLDVKVIQAQWSEIPEHIKSVIGLSAIYFAAMIDANAGAKIENELIKALNNRWDMTLLSLFGNVQSIDFRHQLEVAERWLLEHGNDPILLRVLGKIALKCEFNDKAKKYLAKSISTEPTVEAYRILGNALLDENDKDRASECFKLGLELASNQIINQINS